LFGVSSEDLESSRFKIDGVINAWKHFFDFVGAGDHLFDKVVIFGDDFLINLIATDILYGLAFARTLLDLLMFLDTSKTASFHITLGTGVLGEDIVTDFTEVFATWVLDIDPFRGFRVFWDLLALLDLALGVLLWWQGHWVLTTFTCYMEFIILWGCRLV
jgi:hypothetical protein